MTDNLVDIPISKIDDDKRLVFGWANLPRPATTVAKAYDGSIEEGLQKISDAYSDQFGATNGGYAYVVATFDTYVIGVQEEYKDGSYECKYFQNAYVQEGDSIAFGPGTEVELAFVYKMMGQAALDKGLEEKISKEVYDRAALSLGQEYFEKIKEAIRSGLLKEDLQGDVVPMDELEKAAYEFVLKSRSAGVDHQKDEDGDNPRVIGQLVESFFATEEKYVAMGIPEEVAKGLNLGWFVGFKVEDDEVWKSVKDGKYKMFSVGGKSKKTSY